MPVYIHILLINCYNVLTHTCLGLPEMLDEDALAAEMNFARPDVRPRAASSQQEELITKPSQLSDTDIDTLRSRFLILVELSTGFIRGLSATELLSLERASFKQRESEKLKDAEEKLASNRVNLGLSCTEVRAGQDDRWARLHDTRFLAGAGCSATKLWLTAREVLGLNGHPPISTSPHLPSA
jgi:hypothetical protein